MQAAAGVLEKLIRDRAAAAETEPALRQVAAALDPQSVAALLLTAQLYEKSRQASKATEVYQKVLLIDPNNVAATSGLKRVQKNGS